MTAKQDTGPSEDSIERMVAFAALLRALQCEDAREIREAKLKLKKLGISVGIWEVPR